jgi:predicted acyltransferase
MVKVGGEEGSIPLHTWIHESLFQALAGDLNGSLLYAVCFVVLHWFIAYALYSKKVFIKV